MSDTTPRVSDAVVRLATARETVTVFVVLLLAWGAGFAGVLPKEVWVVDFPALAVAMLVDTFAFNEFSIRGGSVFYPALAVGMYLEAIVVGGAIRWVRQHELFGLRRDSAG
ncbi:MULTISPECIES: hypothetical protein [Haloferax]|uniref:Uncharacterized protein n=1 Tax=Haloferax marinum TaxID=2666143 RepID=A0A6A8G2R7_9EURY|nr:MULTISPECIES: hypothetical protein [Haloferax]KAB1196398.1 hypothetical protein Hfx1150_02230 [Haloferax sp. CBA1150]MRW95391.1 hypothetical protein [Haloferax marinum]